MLQGDFVFGLASAFTGAALYINIAEQPARLRLDDLSLLKQWKSSYPIAARMQGGMVAIVSILGLVVAFLQKDWLWALGSVLMLLNGPYTVFCLLPINRLLESMSITEANGTSRNLIVRWGHLHAIRTLLGLSATITFAWAMS